MQITYLKYDDSALYFKKVPKDKFIEELVKRLVDNGYEIPEGFAWIDAVDRDDSMLIARNVYVHCIIEEINPSDENFHRRKVESIINELAAEMIQDRTVSNPVQSVQR